MKVLTFLGLPWLVILLGAACGVDRALGYKYGQGDGSAIKNVTVTIDASSIVSETNSNFICVTLDWWPSIKEGGWVDASLQVIDINAPLIQAALKALSPLYLRLGGSLQDYIKYTTEYSDENPKSSSSSSWPGNWSKCEPLRPSNNTYSHFEGGCLHLRRLKDLSQLCDETGCEIVFGIGYLYGRTLSNLRDWSGPWDPSNADLLLSYARDNQLKIAGFELGNEVDGEAGILARFPAKEYAGDLTLLRQMVNKYWGENDGKGRPLVIGIDTAHYNTSFTLDLFSHLEKGILDAFTYHSYLLGMSEDPLVSERIMNPKFIEKYKKMASSVKQDVSGFDPKMQIWMGEGGGAAHSGREGVTDAFISAFWYMDQMGQAALLGHQTFCRQTLVGGHYSLLRSAHGPPNPDFYVAYMWRRFMGTKVLRAVTDSEHVRAYVHCAKRGSDGTKTAMVLSNLNRHTSVNVRALFALSVDDKRTDKTLCPYPDAKREEYLFHAVFGNLFGQEVQLNGQVLHTNGGVLPDLQPRLVPCAEELKLPPASYAFVVLPFELAICKI